jgi:hypothetical protein
VARTPDGSEPIEQVSDNDIEINDKHQGKTRK